MQTKRRSTKEKDDRYKRPIDKTNAAGRKETMYRVCITTGSQKNNGTSARVYLRMKGSKGKMNKKCLSKSKAAVKSKTTAENRNSKTKPFKFSPGSTQTFRIKTPDIGDIKSITLEVGNLTECHEERICVCVCVVGTTSLSPFAH